MSCGEPKFCTHTNCPVYNKTCNDCEDYGKYVPISKNIAIDKKEYDRLKDEEKLNDLYREQLSQKPIDLENIELTCKFLILQKEAMEMKYLLDRADQYLSNELSIEPDEDYEDWRADYKKFKEGK